MHDACKLLIVMFFASVSNGANILIIHPFYCGSHGLALRNVGEYLASVGGHNVTQIKFQQANVRNMTPSSFIKVIDLPIRPEPGECGHYINSAGQFDLSRLAGKTLWEWGHTMLAQPLDAFCLTRAGCKTLLFDEKELYNQIADSNFDVALVDISGNECGLALVRSLGIPVASFWGFSFGGLESTYTSVFNTPSYVPAFFSGAKTKMNFFERLHNFLIASCHWTWAFLQMYTVQPYVTRRFPHLAPLRKLVHDIDVHLVNANFLVDSTRLLPPNVKYLGGVTLREAQPLTDGALKDFVDSADKGVVVFSLGFTGFEPKDIPAEVVAAFVKAFSRLEQKVIMRFDKEYIVGKPDNVMVTTWIPQQDLLAHNNTVAFVSHVGMFSLLESVYHSVPILALPIFSDQAENAMRVQEKEFGLVLWDKFNLDAEDIYQKMRKIIADDRYKSSVNRHADIWRDQPVTPAEEMRYWLELLVKYKNLDHLRIHDDHLNLLQYLCIDVIAFLTAIVLLCIFALFQCLVWARRKSLGDVPMKNDKKTL